MFQVYLFGYFRMIKDEQVINEASIRSSQLLKLLVYLLLNRERAITNIELEHCLWEEADTNRKQDALKNLVCRLRKVLDENFGEDQYILTGRGNYQWNSRKEIVIDIELFEKEYSEFTQATSDAKKKTIHRDAAISYYKGIFLNNVESDYWNHKRIQYQSMYLKLVESVYYEFLKNEDYQEIERLAVQVLNSDPFDENWNKYLVASLITQNKVSQAERYYKGLEKNTNGLGNIQKSSLLRIVRNEIGKANFTEKVISEHKLIQEMQNLKKEKGAFKCNFNDFKILLNLQYIRDKRSKDNTYILMLTVSTDSIKAGAATEVHDFLINMAMEELDATVTENLRECDIVCRCSDCQFLILLDKARYENVIKIAKRINRLFENCKASAMTNLEINVKKIEY